MTKIHVAGDLAGGGAYRLIQRKDWRYFQVFEDPFPAELNPLKKGWVLMQPTMPIALQHRETGELSLLRRGDLAFFLPAPPWRLVRIRPQVPLGFSCIQLSGDWPEPLYSLLQDPPRAWIEKGWVVLRSPALKELFWTMAGEMMEGQGIRPLARDMFLVLLGNELQRTRREPIRDKMPCLLYRSYLQKILDHIEHGLGEPNRAEDLAALAHLSVDHFTRVFQKATGWTPHQYLLERRLQRATNLLAQGERCCDVAQSLGFFDPPAFTRAFKRRFGQTPGEYQRPFA